MKLKLCAPFNSRTRTACHHFCTFQTPKAFTGIILIFGLEQVWLEPQTTVREQLIQNSSTNIPPNPSPLICDCGGVIVMQPGIKNSDNKNDKLFFRTPAFDSEQPQI